MSNLSKALKMVREGKSLEFISKVLGVSMPLLEGMLREQATNKKTADKSFMPRSFVKENFTVLKTKDSRDIDAQALEKQREEEELARKKAEKDKKAYELLRVFLKKYPKLFSVKDPKPLAIGVDKALLAELSSEGVGKKDISQAISRYVRRQAYIESVIAGDCRYDLQGNPVGEVTQEHREMALKQNKKRQENE